ncbi:MULTISPECIES: SDR family oxidoreductase [unclassified Schlesneria]|uniref:SDR family oxidoreductase n=1 Tax=unclassified Schlesneria TaxID=2762017 RepID=UPI002EFF4084
MRCLIFGCGYLGKRVAKRWVAKGHQVFAVTRFAANAESFQRESIQPLVADICEPATLSELPEVDLVLHAVGFDRSSGRTHEEVSCVALSNILRAIDNQRPRFIHISSTSVYGQSDGGWVDEDSLCQPELAGGERCLRAENLIRDQFFAGSLSGLQILRLAGIYGPGRLLSRIESLRAGVPFSGRGDAWLNLIHVDDAADAVIACAEGGGDFSVWNVVDDQPIPRATYFSTLARLVGAPEPVFDSAQPAARGSGGINKRVSNRKIREELGWRPQYSSIETGLPSAIRSAE